MAKAGEKPQRAGAWPPHRFFWAFFLVAGIGIFVALTSDGREPVWALKSQWVYRAEVGAALIGLTYLVLLAAWLAWHGLTFDRVELPGGAALEAPQPAQELDQAASEFAAFQGDTEASLQAHTKAIDNINERLEALERGKPSLGRHLVRFLR